MPPQMIPGPGQNHPPQGLANMPQGQPIPQMVPQQHQQPQMGMPEQQTVQPVPIPQQAPVVQVPQQQQVQPPAAVEKPVEPEPSIGELISFD